MAYPFYHSMLIEIHIFSSFGAVYDVVVDTFPRHFIFLIFLLLLLFFLCVWKNRSNIHLCRIFSSHASLIFFSFFVCISHHIIDEQKRMKNMSKLTEKEEQIKSNTAENEKENAFPSYFSLFSSNFLLLQIFHDFFLC